MFIKIFYVNKYDYLIREMCFDVFKCKMIWGGSSLNWIKVVCDDDFKYL